MGRWDPFRPAVMLGRGATNRVAIEASIEART